MSSILSLVRLPGQDVAEKLGQVLLHFVWQGFLVAVFIGLLLAVLRRSTANTRYFVSCAGLMLMALLPAITCFVVPNPIIAGFAADSVAAFQNVESELDKSRPVSSIVVSPDSAAFADHRSETTTLNVISGPVTVPPSPTGHVVGESLTTTIGNIFRPWLSSIAGIWLFGVVVLSLRLVLTWKQVHKLQIEGVLAANVAHLALLNRLSEKLGVWQLVRLLESSLVEVPTVMGWLKPVILLPIASVTALTTNQLEAILAHELAHIRRADYAVNILQSLVETLLFYHPAVWWISSRIRQEREHCCDDLAASICGDATSYVAALVRMEELRCEPSSVALAARGGDLLCRVRRLLSPVHKDRLSPWWLTGTLSLSIAATIIGLPLCFRLNSPQIMANDDHTSETIVAGNDEVKPSEAKDEPKDFARELTPSMIADKIEETWKRYQSVEYTATFEETRNANAFGNDPQPVLANGKGEIRYVSDGNRWLVAEKSPLYQSGKTKTVLKENVSAFDGMYHTVSDGGRFVIGQDDSQSERLGPKELFWQAGLSSDWFLAALRRPEAKLAEKIALSEMTCVHILVQWKPDWDTEDRAFDILICPEQNWLPRRVTIRRGGKLLAESSIPSIGTTKSGLCYPTRIDIERPESDSTPKRATTISHFRDRTDFTIQDFQIERPLGIDIYDPQQGFAFHNDPWWDEMAPWIHENIVWPLPDFNGQLNELASYCNPRMFGTSAPRLIPGEWLTESVNPGWDRPERKLSLLYFFSGRLIPNTPKYLKALDHLHRRYREGGFEVIGIVSHSESVDVSRQSVKELNLSFPITIDSSATDADIRAKAEGSKWGATSVAFQQQAYTGAVLIDQAGMIVAIKGAEAIARDGFGGFETFIRDRLREANGVVDPPDLRRFFVNRTSRLMRGFAPTASEYDEAIRDSSVTWLANAQKKIAATIQGSQIELSSTHRLTVENALSDLNRDHSQIPISGIIRIEEEWKRRVSKATGTGEIRGTICRETGESASGIQAQISLVPIIKLLNTNTMGSWFVGYDRSRHQVVETDSAGKFVIGKLPKGSYELTINSEGSGKTTRTVHLANHDSHVELDATLSPGGKIKGKVVDRKGNVIPNAKVKAILRFASVDNPDSHTTGNLPQQPVTTSQTGEFSFEGLFEGKYIFEVSANGFELLKSEKIEATHSEAEFILSPIEQGTSAKP